MHRQIETLMQDSAIRKAFGNRVKQLRKQHGWTQKELAIKIDANYQQLNKYESGIHTPPLDKLILLADALNTSVDYLISGNLVEDSPMANNSLFKRFKALETFDKEDQATVINVIDAIIAKRQVENAIQPL